MIHSLGRLLLAPVVMGLLSCAAIPAADSTPGRPNIIFILLDDQGWGDAGAFGHPYMKTPHIDRLVGQSARFEQFYVANPVCSPSRAAFMTGHYPARHRVHGHFAKPALNAARGMPNWLDPELMTVFDLARSAGYATGHFGKWHLGAGKDAPAPDAYGVDDFRTINSIKATWKQGIFKLAFEKGRGPYVRFTEGKDRNSRFKGEKDPYFRAKSTGLFVDEAIRFIEAHRDQPFFMNLWTLVPHAILNPTPEELAVYDDLQVSPEDFPDWMRQYVANASHPQQQMKVYCAAMTGLDTALGRLFDFLDAQGLAENTIIFMSSDNGPEDYHINTAANAGMGFPGVLRARKRSLYEGGLRTQLLVRWPGKIEAGRVDKASLLTAVDFLPTVAKLIGAELPEELHPDGEDVSDRLLGASHPRERPILWEWRFPSRFPRASNPAYRPPGLAIRDNEWKLLVNPDGKRVELYRPVDDPEERHNLADQYPDVVNRLKPIVLQWQKTLPLGPTYNKGIRKKERNGG
jgi:N-acetylgalactosamine-6-sulfatase